MGCYDTLHYGDRSVQVKCLGSKLRNYHVGDTVPPLHIMKPIDCGMRIN